MDQQNRFTYVNDKYCETFGKTREELVGKSFVPLVHEEDQQHTLEEMEKLKKPPYRCQIEQRAYTVNGWRWLHWEDSAIVDKDGNILEVQGVGRDITELKEKEAALEKKNLEMQSLLTHTPAVIYAYRMVDGKPDITYINDNVREVLGYEPGQFLHNFSNWIDCLHPDDLTLLQEKRIYDQQYHQRAKAGMANTVSGMPGETTGGWQISRRRHSTWMATWSSSVRGLTSPGGVKWRMH